MKRRHAALLLTAGLVAPALAFAHGPTRQKVTETVDIHRSPADVWKVVGDYGDLPAWHPAFKTGPADKGNEAGSVRILTLNAPGDPTIRETLLDYDNEKMSYHYKMDDPDVKVLPIKNYTSWISVRSDGHGGSTVEWKGAFYRGYMNNDPPADQNDEAAVKAVTGAYRAGLDNLKKTLEAKS